jgi:hypothetical protein
LPHDSTGRPSNKSNAAVFCERVRIPFHPLK